MPHSAPRSQNDTPIPHSQNKRKQGPNNRMVSTKQNLKSFAKNVIPFANFRLSHNIL